jgi:hypothetical protein
VNLTRLAAARKISARVAFRMRKIVLVAKNLVSLTISIKIFMNYFFNSKSTVQMSVDGGELSKFTMTT